MGVDVDACDLHTGAFTSTVRESVLKVDPGKKIPSLTGDSNPPQYCAWPFCPPRDLHYELCVVALVPHTT